MNRKIIGFVADSGRTVHNQLIFGLITLALLQQKLVLSSEQGSQLLAELRGLNIINSVNQYVWPQFTTRFSERPYYGQLNTLLMAAVANRDKFFSAMFGESMFGNTSGGITINGLCDKSGLIICFGNPGAFSDPSSERQYNAGRLLSISLVFEPSTRAGQDQPFSLKRVICPKQPALAQVLFVDLQG